MGAGGWLKAWNKGAGAWGGSLRAWGPGAWRGLRGWGPGGGLDPQGTSGRTFVRSFVRSFARTDGKFTPLFYRTSSPSGPLPKRHLRDLERPKKELRGLARR